MIQIEYLKRAYGLLKHPDVTEVWRRGFKNKFDHTYFGVLHILSRVLLDVGNYSESIKYLKEAIEIQEGRFKPRKGKLAYEYSFLAKAYAELGDFEEAEDALSDADGYLSNVKYKSKRSQRFKLFHEQTSLMTNGIIQSSQGNLREAEEYYLRAINKMEGYTRGRKGRTWMMRARVKGRYLVENLLAQGRIAEAEAQSIVGIRYSLEKFGYKNFITAIILQSYGKVLIARERYEDAQKVINLTKTIFDGIGVLPTAIGRIKLKMSLADIYIAQDEWVKAKNIYREVYQVLESEPEVRKGLFYENVNWAMILAFNNQFDEAEKIAQAAIEKNSDVFGSDHTNTAIATGVLALVKSRNGNHEQAKALYEDIIPVFVKASDSESSSGLNTQKTRLIMESYLALLFAENKKGNKKAAQRAFYISQLVQGRNVQNAVASSAARASIKDVELVKLVRQEQNAKRKIESGYNTLVTNHSSTNNESKSLVSDTKARIDQLVKAREAILREINDRFPDYANLVRPKPVSTESIASVLQKDEALILTYSGSNDLYTWTVLSDGQMHLNSKSIKKKILQSKIQKIREGLDLQITSLDEVPVFDVEMAHEFYNNILRPSAHLWRPKKNIVVVADGALSSIPFSVFVTEVPTRIRHRSALKFKEYRKVSWLADKHATSYVPSASTLINLRKLKIQKKPNMKFAGFGNPVFGSEKSAPSSGVIKSRGAIKLSMRGLRKTKSAASLDNKKVSTGNLDMLIALPETADEVLQVASALKVGTVGNVFLGNAASEKRVKNMKLNNRRVLMFATHALLPGDLDGLVQPAIALTSPTASQGTGKNDGLLTMGEVMGLNLNADWVVLSACNTGAASGRGATAVSGLGQAFFYAGARSLLVSHWPVETTSAREITTGLFEKQVANKSLTRAMALNYTVKELIHEKTYKDNTGKDVFSYAHPVFWAPFTVVGDGTGTLQ